jgi:hypothetical protein
MSLVQCTFVRASVPIFPEPCCIIFHVCLQAKVTQQANMMAGKRSAPMWALAAIMFLGWNEFMAVLWNPVLLIAGLLAFMFGYQMYNELDVDAELQRGWVMGAMNIWSKLGDVLKSVSVWGGVSAAAGLSSCRRTQLC